MPNFDRTGPEGQGAMTGRRAGLCNPRNKNLSREELMEEKQDDIRPRYGRGLARGFRGGRPARRHRNRW